MKDIRFGRTLYARREGVFAEPLGEQLVLFDSSTRESVVLDVAESFVWSRCDGDTTVGEVVEVFARLNPNGQAEADVLAAVDLLAEKGLLLDENLVPVMPGEHSRRSFLNYGALTGKAAIAFSLIGSFLRPSSAEAGGSSKRGKGHDDHGRGHGYGHDKARGKGHDKHHTPDPIDCYGGWGEWGECDWFMQAREYTVIVPAANGGLACEVDDGTVEVRECGVPVDCEGTWGAWSSCSATCGGGTSARNFNVTTPAANGGAACPVSPETQTCGTSPCFVGCTDCDRASDVCNSGVCTHQCSFDNQGASNEGDCCELDAGVWIDDC